MNKGDKAVEIVEIVPVLACVLNQLCLSNDEILFDPKESNSKFHALRIPAIGLREYLERVARYSGCSAECFVLALVYIDRIIQSSPNFVVNSYSIHRLLITSVMLAAKFFDDHYYNNAYFAKVGGVAYAEMNSLEVEFLFMLNFDLFVTSETYKQYYDELWGHANSSVATTCGCSTAHVPPLILPFGDTKEKGSEVQNERVSDEILEKDKPLITASGKETLDHEDVGLHNLNKPEGSDMGQWDTSRLTGTAIQTDVLSRDESSNSEDGDAGRFQSSVPLTTSSTSTSTGSTSTGSTSTGSTCVQTVNVMLDIVSPTIIRTETVLFPFPSPVEYNVHSNCIHEDSDDATPTCSHKHLDDSSCSILKQTSLEHKPAGISSTTVASGLWQSIALSVH